MIKIISVRHNHFLFYLLLFPLLLCAYLPQAIAQDAEKALGVKTLEYRDKTRNRPVIIELWYPTEQQEPSESESSDLWIHPKEVRNAQIAKNQTKYPLLLMSHGHRGDRRERSWLANMLAKEGYVIASVDHYGDTRSTFNPMISLCFWNRFLDISFAIDQLLKEPLIESYIDKNKIGFIGYSLGGMTGLGLAGAKAKNVQKTILRAIRSYKEISPEMISQIDFSNSENSYLEPRIKAMLLICPALFVYPTENLKKVNIPIGLIAAIQDEVLPHKNHSYQIIKQAIPRRLKIMRKKEVSHYSFLNHISEAGKIFFHKPSQKNSPRCDRDLIHKEAGLFAIDFFKEILKN